MKSSSPLLQLHTQIYLSFFTILWGAHKVFPVSLTFLHSYSFIIPRYSNRLRNANINTLILSLSLSSSLSRYLCPFSYNNSLLHLLMRYFYLLLDNSNSFSISLYISLSIFAHLAATTHTLAVTNVILLGTLRQFKLLFFICPFSNNNTLLKVLM